MPSHLPLFILNAMASRKPMARRKLRLVRALQLGGFFQAGPGETCEPSTRQSFANSVINTYREKGVGEGGQVDARRMMGVGMLVNAVRMRAPVHTFADQCGYVVLGLFVGCEVLACLVCSACAQYARACE